VESGGVILESMPDARLIIDKHPGPLNMAVDEALLLSAPTSGPTLRFYQWEEPTLSLGYFQSLSERASHAASGNCPVVRRSTGGGAILHHHELTYSFTTPLSEHDKAAVPQLYDAFHQSLIEALANWNIQASLVRDSLQQIGHEPFLCFQRRAAGDVVLAGSKICGSAQRRQKRALLQHGSVLLRRSEFAPELPGINDRSEVELTAESLAESWLALLEKRLGLSFQPGPLSIEEWTCAQRLAEDRFGAGAWSSRR